MSERSTTEFTSSDKKNFDYLIEEHTDSDCIENEISEIVDHLKEERYDIGRNSFLNLPDDNNILVQYLHQLDEKIETKGILKKKVVDRGEIRERSIYVNISGSEVPQKKDRIRSIASDFGFNISEEIKNSITIHKETEGEYSDSEYPFRYDALLILIIFGEIFEQNVEPSEVIQSVVSIYEQITGVVNVNDLVDTSEERDGLTSDCQESRDKEKTKLSSKKNRRRRKEEQSIPSIAESARGDLDTDTLEKIESVYGFGFLESNEQIQYIGKSTWGVRITSDAVDDRLGSANYNFATDRGVRLVVENEDEFVDDIVISYDYIKQVEYNSGMRKDSITIHTNGDFTLDVSELNTNSWREVFDKQTREPTIKSPSIKFRLRASKESGTSVDDIVSYIRDRVKEVKEAVESQYSNLQRKSNRLDSKEINIPEPNSFNTVSECQKKYNKLEAKIKNWRSAESQYSKLNRKSRRLDSTQIEVPKPDSFKSVDRCKRKYDKLETKIENWRSAESQYSKLNRKSRRLDSKQIAIPKPDSFESVDRCERKYDKLETKVEKWKPVDNQYHDLKKKSNRLDSKEVEVPEPDSFESVDRCERKYDELETKVEKWKQAKNQYSNLREIQSKIKQQIADSPAERFWVEYLPEAEPPEEFDKPAKPTNEFGSIRAELEIINPMIIQAVEIEDCISSHASKTMSTHTEHMTIQQIHQECIDRLDNDQDPSEVKSNLEQLNDTLSLASNLTDMADNLPIDPTQKLIDTIRDDGIPESEKLQEWQALIQKVEKISTFMNDIDLPHPSVDAEHWEESLEMAIEEQYVNILSPIVDQVEKMESGMWELDDLQQISWQEFETLIGTLYESFGYETEVTSDTADMGVDVWAADSDERVAIQAKRYQEGNRVGRETLQKTASTLAKGDADRVIVVTTSEFARTAKEYSDSFGSEIKLINGEELRNQLNHSDLPPMKSY